MDARLKGAVSLNKQKKSKSPVAMLPYSIKVNFKIAMEFPQWGANLPHSWLEPFSGSWQKSNTSIFLGKRAFDY